MSDRRRQTNCRTRRFVFGVAVALVAIVGAARETRSSGLLTDFVRFVIPLGLPADVWDYYIPKDNPLTEEKIELGRQLFFEKRLSADGNISCATCHDPQLAFTDGKKVAEGIGGRRGTRNSPTILNALFYPGMFWDGRADRLEDQARLPLTNPLEMGNESIETVIARVRAAPEFVSAFQRVFGGEPTIARLAQAVAAYERTLIAGDSAFDRFAAGNQNAIGAEAKRRGEGFLFDSSGAWRHTRPAR